MRISIATAAFAASMICFSWPASSETFQADGVSVNLPLLDDHCYLTREHAVERSYYEVQDKLQSGKNYVVAIAVPCRLRAKLRNGEHVFEKAMWLLNAPKGSVIRVPPNYTRERILNEVSQGLPKLDLGKMRSDIGERAKGSGWDIGLNQMRVIGQDRNAVYIAGLFTVGIVGEQNYKVAGVFALTMMQNRIFSFNLYHPFKDQTTFDRLSIRVKQMMATTIDMNTAQSANPIGGLGVEQGISAISNFMDSIDWAPVALKAIGGAAVGGILLGLAALVRRRKRNKHDSV